MSVRGPPASVHVPAGSRDGNLAPSHCVTFVARCQDESGLSVLRNSVFHGYSGHPTCRCRGAPCGLPFRSCYTAGDRREGTRPSPTSLNPSPHARRAIQSKSGGKLPHSRKTPVDAQGGRAYGVCKRACALSGIPRRAPRSPSTHHDYSHIRAGSSRSSTRD